MPIIKARQEMNHLEPGATLKVISTDRGSMSDFQGWAKSARNIELLKQEEESKEGKSLFIHYLKKVG